MFITNHALAGATLGLLTRRPAVAFVTGVASHVAMDMVLHWGDERLDWDGFVEVAKVDGTVGLAVCAALLAVAPAPARPAVAAGIAGAAIDLGINTTISDETSLHERASALAGWNTVTGARGLAAPFVAGGLVQLGVLDVTAALVLCVAVAAVGVVMFARVEGARSGRLTTDTTVYSVPNAEPA